MYNDAETEERTGSRKNPLPCENPGLESWDDDAVVFGQDNSAHFTPSSSRRRSVSTSVNRIEIPDLSSTLYHQDPLEEEVLENMVWDAQQYNGYKLNCNKKQMKLAL